MRRLMVVLFALPIFFMMSSPASAWGTTAKTTAAQQHGVTPSDAQLESVIQAKLAKSKVGKDGFKFHVQKGVVTWEGSTNVPQHKGSATRMARTAGAAQVINNIQVSGGGKDKAAVSLKKAQVVQ